MGIGGGWSSSCSFLFSLLCILFAKVSPLMMTFVKGLNQRFCIFWAAEGIFVGWMGSTGS